MSRVEPLVVHDAVPAGVLQDLYRHLAVLDADFAEPPDFPEPLARALLAVLSAHYDEAARAFNGYSGGIDATEGRAWIGLHGTALALRPSHGYMSGLNDWHIDERFAGCPLLRFVLYGGSWEGGALELRSGSSVVPVAGDVVAIPTWEEHRVLPVTAGRRVIVPGVAGSGRLPFGDYPYCLQRDTRGGEWRNVAAVQ